MVEREKLSLCSSDGVRYLPGGEKSTAVRPGTPPSPSPSPGPFRGELGVGGQLNGPSAGGLGAKCPQI